MNPFLHTSFFLPSHSGRISKLPVVLLVRFLLFRLMFTSGVVKLTSECPTCQSRYLFLFFFFSSFFSSNLLLVSNAIGWDLTALLYH